MSTTSAPVMSAASRQSAAASAPASVRSLPGSAKPGAFFREFVRHPLQTAAIAPSSAALAQAMVRELDFSRIRCLVEFGPGMGVFTKAALAAMPPGWLRSEGGQGVFIAIEFNPHMAQRVATEHPGATVVHDSAENILAIAQRHGFGPGEVDCVISGLGFVSFPPALCTSILEATHRALRPGPASGAHASKAQFPSGGIGEFRTFSYHVAQFLPGAWHFRREIRRIFRLSRTQHGAWLNIPPAFVYRCVK